MLLSEFPTDVWSVISNWLPGLDVLKLRVVGVARLKATIEETPISLHFNWISTKLSRCPPPLLSLKRLCSLVVLQSTSRRAGWKLDASLFSSLPQTIKTIRLSFTDFTIEDINALPRTLTELDIHSWADITPCIAGLPPNLLSFGTNSQFSASTLPSLPPHLTSLYFSIKFFNESVADLPRGLLSLTHRNAPSISDEGILLLPQNLTRLVLCHTNITDVGFAAIPKTLTHLDVTGAEQLTNAVWALLPRPLVTLVLPKTPISHLEDSDLLNLPKGLKGFHINEARRLTEHSIKCFPDSFFEPGSCYMPSHLHKYAAERYMKQITNPIFELPHWMSPLVNEPTLKKSYPSHLTEVILTAARHLSVDYFSYLPQNLRSLECHDLLNLTDSGISKLPRNLEVFSANLASLVTDAGLTNLPPKLTSLMLDGTEHPTDDVMALLPRTLTVLGLAKAVKISSVGIENMPRSLIYLDIGRSTRIDQTAIKALPPNLVSLCISAARNVVNEDIQFLPRSLQYVNLSTARKLTTECSSHFPTGCKVILPFDRDLFAEW